MWVVVIFLFIFGMLVISIIKKDKQREYEEKQRRYNERHDQRASRLFEQQEKRKQPNKSLVTVEATTVDNSEYEYEYNIKGINYCYIDDSMLGYFIGTAKALRSNPHDPYAIGVYRGNRRVGFLPRGNRELHAKITVLGGSATLDGYIAKTSDDDGREFYYGKANVLLI